MAKKMASKQIDTEKGFGITEDDRDPVTGRRYKTTKKMVSLITLLNEELEMVPSRDPLTGMENVDRMDNARFLVRRIVEDAIDGDVNLIKEILNRIEGRVAVKVDGPIAIEQRVVNFGKEDVASALETLVHCGAIMINSN